jgi:glycosidase
MDQYCLGELLVALTGDIVPSQLYAVRQIVRQINEIRDVSRHPEKAVRAGTLNAMELINETLHSVLTLYQKEGNPEAFRLARKRITRNLGTHSVERTLSRFVKLFPPIEVYQGGHSVRDYMKGDTAGMPNDLIALEEMLLLFLANGNPAFSSLAEMFGDGDLKKGTEYLRLMETLERFFKTQPAFGPHHQPVMDLLRAPMIAAPDSLEGQLLYIRDHWSSLLSGDLVIRILLALDLFREEGKPRFVGPGPALVPCFEPGTGLYDEPERFSRDLDWMPHVVLIAKSVYVWLDQLGKKYGRVITRLDQIPDEELDSLARWGFTGLWLIGIWERSLASQKIKQLTGNPEALASAYAVYDYVIAGDLGGENAYENLRERAWQRGVRLASDMVPNHTGIDSRWVLEHSDWFVQLDYCPFPNYRFTGPDLSADGRVGIYVEDGYWDRTDAAVVFKWVDRMSGNVRYIFHGNDGTGMPWNDTAQLNFLNGHVREAVTQQILHVARKFPIIRFDAAMTLTKKHFQRLWHPQPGTGGDIPSRAEHPMNREEFDRLFPVEFWRDVVDRVARECPDTLLLAEAFWLMEGYFVRTLGMHRVYNSAFMNMLKMEENAKYRSVIKNVLEFNPEILRRFVNFMNNPDEATAIEQFGKGDKYFGVALMMVTMPGLPLFGHGQIEGFTEKYGMEYRRAYWDEEPDWNLVQRHEAEIFPLMRKRPLFSGIENFVLYDFQEDGGSVNENVFAYSNRAGNERALIIYNNKYETARGRVSTSTSIAVRAEQLGEKRLVQKSLADGLAVQTEAPYFYVFRDHKSGLEYIRQGSKFADQGLHIELGAYQVHLFLDFREIQDNREGDYARLESFLNGKGVSDMEEALKAMLLAPIHDPFKEIMDPMTLQRLATMRRDGLDAPESEETIDRLKHSIERFLNQVKKRSGGSGDCSQIASDQARRIRGLVRFDRLHRSSVLNGFEEAKAAISALKEAIPSGRGLRDSFWRVFLGWAMVCDIGRISSDCGYEQQSAAWMDEWVLGKIISRTFQSFGIDEATAWWETDLVKILVAHRGWFSSKRAEMRSNLKAPFFESHVQEFLQFNWHANVLWYNKERFEQLTDWLLVVSIVQLLAGDIELDGKMVEGIMDRYGVIQRVRQEAVRSQYRVDAMVDTLDRL